jgi:hypothetical protein
MRAIFSTLRADNLPETGNRQYENRGARTQLDAMAQVAQ